MRLTGRARALRDAGQRERAIVGQRFDALFWHTRHIETLKLQVGVSSARAPPVRMPIGCSAIRADGASSGPAGWCRRRLDRKVRRLDRGLLRDVPAGLLREHRQDG
eukprot:SAG11_NODE_28785_length_318_cov_0.525114_1_plen_105_part_11